MYTNYKILNLYEHGANYFLRNSKTSTRIMFTSPAKIIAKIVLPIKIAFLRVAYIWLNNKG